MNQKISREQTREFFMQIPAIIDYLPLSPHEFRLYAHYVRVCGGVEGMCWESVRTTAAFCNIGKSVVSDTRDGLEQYNLIYTNKEQRANDKQLPVHVKIRDVWEINSRFLTLVRKHGMPSLEKAREWILFELDQNLDDSPFDESEEEVVDEIEDSPDAHFEVSATRTGCPPHGQSEMGSDQVSVTRTGRPSRGQGVPDADRVSATRTVRPYHGQSVRTADGGVRQEGHNKIQYNKISNNKIPDSQIAINQIPTIAAAAGGQLLQEKTPAREITPRARIGEAEAAEGDQADMWWDEAGAWVYRPAVERVCLDYMSLDNDWRDQQEILGNAEPKELFRLLLWLKRASWDEFAGIENVPGYIRSRYKTERPKFSKRDMQEVLGWIERYTQPEESPF